MRNNLPTALALGALGVLVLAFIVGAQRSGAAYNVYRPPNGWHRTQVLAPGLGVWVHPSDNQNISVQATRFSGSLAGFTQLQIAQIGQLPGSKIGSVQQAKVCGSHPASYIAYQATANNKVLVYEQMLTIWSGVAYLATYAREAGQPSIYEARASLTTLCGGGVPVARPAAPGTRPSSPVQQPAAPGTPYLGPSQAPATYGPPAPTVTPTSGL